MLKANLSVEMYYALYSFLREDILNLADCKFGDFFSSKSFG